MATKKSSSKKETVQKEKSTMIKIAETIGQVAGEISVKKDQLTDMASHAIDAIKSKIHDITTPNVKPVKKAAKAVAKKASPKKAVKAVAKKVIKKPAKALAKKVSSVKQDVKKSAKKAAKKVRGKK